MFQACCMTLVHVSRATPASHRGESDSIPGQSMWDIWWMNWLCDRLLSECFSLLLSVSIHKRSIPISTNMLLWAGHTSKALVPSNLAIGEHWLERYSSPCKTLRTQNVSGTGLFPSTWIFPSQLNSTNAPVNSHLNTTNIRRRSGSIGQKSTLAVFFRAP